MWNYSIANRIITNKDVWWVNRWPCLSVNMCACVFFVFFLRKFYRKRIHFWYLFSVCWFHSGKCRRHCQIVCAECAHTTQIHLTDVSMVRAEGQTTRTRRTTTIQPLPCEWKTKGDTNNTTTPSKYQFGFCIQSIWPRRNGAGNVPIFLRCISGRMKEKKATNEEERVSAMRRTSWTECHRSDQAHLQSISIEIFYLSMSISFSFFQWWISMKYIRIFARCISI